MDLRTVIFFFSVFVFFSCHSWAQDQTDVDCEAEWRVNVTWENKFVVQWSGAERNADIRIRVSANSSWCNFPKGSYFQGTFSKRLLEISMSCSNSEHEFNATIICNDAEMNNKIISGVWTPPDAPADITLESATNTSLKIKWEAPPGNVILYNISLNKKEYYSSTTASFNITNLSPHTEYEVQVQAKNDYYWSEFSNPETLRTLEGLPEAPGGLQSESITNTSVTMRWEVPNPKRGEIRNYTLQWKEVNAKDLEAQNQTTNELSLEIQSLKPYTNYSFQVRATTFAGEGPWTDPVYVKTKEGVPLAPQNLRISRVTNTSMQIEWNEPQPFLGQILNYTLELTNTDREETIWTGNTSKTFYHHENLVPYSNYSIRVQAITKAGPGDWSENKIFRTEEGVPSAPQSLNISKLTNTSMQVEWNEPQPFVGHILNYTLELNNTDSKEILWAGNISKTFYNKENLVPYSNYSIRVQAITKAGPGDWSENKIFRTEEGVPSAPRSLNISKLTNTSMKFEWNEPQPFVGHILNYTLELNNIDSKEILWAGNISKTFYNNENLVPYSNYSIRVQAITKAGPGDWSENKIFRTKEGVPFPPSKPEKVSITDTSISIKWSEPQPPRGPILEYIVEWKNINETSDKNESVTKEKILIIEKLNAYTDYSIRVRGRTVAGTGGWSEELQARTKSGVPLAPQRPEVKDFTNTSVLIQWKEPTPFKGPILSYTVKWTNLKGNSLEDSVKDSTQFNITNLEPFGNYTIQVRATTDAGDGEWSQKLDVQTKPGVPLEPLNVQGKHVTNTSIEIQWDEPTLNRGPIYNYTVKWAKSNTKESEIRIVEPESNSGFLIDNLQPFTNYTIQVRATTEAGDGPWSSELQIRTGIGVPWPPQKVRGEKLTNCTIHLAWEEPEPSTGPILFYTLQWTNVILKTSNKTNMDGSITSYVIKGLEPYTNYSIQILAETKAGKGNWSDEVVIRTEIGIPTKPRDVKYSNVTNTTIKLEWNVPKPSNGPIERYIVQWTNLKSNSSVKNTTTDRFYNIDNLNPYTNYSIQICAKTSAGEGPWSEDLITQTKIGIASPPQNVSFTEATAFAIQLSWNIPEYPNSPVEDLKYLVLWKAADKEIIRSEVEQPSFSAVNLTAYTEYTFLIFAQTEVGLSLPSDPLTVRTAIAEPSVPQNLSVVYVTSTTILIEWSIPEYPNGPELSYHLQWRKEEDEQGRKDDKTKDTHYELKELEPYTSYSVQVRANTSAGYGPFTEWLPISTEIAIPEPAKIKAFSGTSTTVLVKWNKTGPYPGPVSYYLEVWQIPNECSSKSEPFLVENPQNPKGNEDSENWKEQRDVTVEELIPYTSYFFRVKLTTKAGSKTSESSNVIKTPADVPDAPQNVKAKCDQLPTEAEVSWAPPKYPKGHIIEYIVEYGLENLDKDNEYVSVTNPCEEQKITLRNLRPERNYIIAIRARVQGVTSDGRPAYLKSCILPAGIPPLGDASKILVKESGPHRLMIEWSRDTFSDDMGALVRYAVLVGLTDALGNATTGKTSENLPNWSKFTAGESDYYQATPPEWNPFVENLNDSLECKRKGDGTIVKCTIGLENDCPNNQSYCNGPLRPATEYEMKLRAFTRGGYAESQPLLARTAPTPSSSYIGALAAGITLLLIVIFLLMGLMVLQRKGKLEPLRQVIRSRFGHIAPSAPPIPEPPQQIEIYQTRGPLNVHNFSDHVRTMMSDSHLRFSQEFEALKHSSPQFPCTTAEMDENRGKNRWMNIYPYDHSRVKLLPLGDEPGSDFVNANYIPGNSSRREYIASQGPLPNTVDDFWRMIWEQSVTVIVMLTQCVERGKSKCEQYWPAPGEIKYYGDLQVRTLSESMLSSYVIRVFHVQLGPRELRVKQMHFTRWPDFGCPESPDDLINFVRAVRDHLPRVQPGPILVHCSAGVGRTGTFIAVDRLSQQLMRSDIIDVYGTVLDLRQHRTNMVQTEDQYIYIHLCVNQLIRERAAENEDEYEEAIYSNVGAMKDTGV